MPAANLNNIATQDNYVDALTVFFGRPRPSFTLNVTNNGVYYTLAVVSTSARDPAFEPGEHFLGPTLNSFRSPSAEGFPADALFAGIKLRSSAAGLPANVTVM